MGSIIVIHRITLDGLFYSGKIVTIGKGRKLAIILILHYVKKN